MAPGTSRASLAVSITMTALRPALTALLLLAPCVAEAQAPAEDLPDVTVEAGRDLTGLHRLLNSPRTPFDPVANEDGRDSFSRFVGGLRKALEPHPALLAEVPAKPGKWADDVRGLLVRGYLTRLHYNDLPAALGELVRLRTVAPPGGAVAEDPAFRQVGEWLEARCARFGLGFKPVAGGRAWAVTLGKGKTRLGLVAHVDVPDASAEGWRHDPWAGTFAERSVWGRGAAGGKAGLVTALYALKAVRDSGVPLKGQALLLVTTAQHAGRGDLAMARKQAKLPKATIVTGAPFPLSVGEKGAATVTVRAAPGDEPDAATQGFRIVSLHGGGDPARVATEASAVLDPRDLPSRRAVGAVRRNLTLMRARRPELEAVLEEGAHLSVRFTGRPGHAADPAAGSSALADLVVFLADYLGVFPDHRGRLVRFLAAHVGHETNGTRLGVHHTHPAMTPTTVNLGTLAEGPDGPVATLDVRWPLGRTVGEQTAAIRARARDFVGTVGGSLEVSVTGTDPVLVDAEAPYVQTLRGVYRQLVRRDPPPRTLARPTYARLIPGAVAFGPAPADTEPDPEAVDERIGMEELDLAARVYATTILELLAK